MHIQIDHQPANVVDESHAIVPMRTVCARAAVVAVAELGSKTAAANALGISTRTLYRLLRAAGATFDENRVAPMLRARRRRREADRIGKPVTWSGWL
jgi:hypothetical protein